MDGCADELASTTNARLLLSLLLSSAALSRETEGGRHVKRQASKAAHPTALFADRGMHTSTPNHTAVNQCGGLTMERFKVNKHHSPLAETAGGYVRLGSVPAVFLDVRCCLLLYSNDWASLLLRVSWHTSISICCSAAAILCKVMTSHVRLIREHIYIYGMSS